MQAAASGSGSRRPTSSKTSVTKKRKTLAARKLTAWRLYMDTLSPKRTKQESAEAMGNLIGMGWKMVESIESGVRGVGVVLAVRIQSASAEYALKHGKAVAAAGLQLPIRCEDWCAE